MIKSRMAQRGQGGFTLIELLVVVAILAILVGVAVVGVGAMQKNAKKSACKSDKDTIETAAEAWGLEDGNTGLPSVQDLIDDGLLKKVKSADWGAMTTDSTGAFVATANGSGKWAAVQTECNA